MHFTRIEKNTRGLEALIDIDAACFDTPWTVAQWRAEVENPENRILLVSVDEELLYPVGFISYGISGDDIELKKIAILSPYRRKHAASQALEKMLEDARSMDAHNIIIEVAVTNLAAIRFYESHAFYKIHVRKKYYNNLVDALVMQKEV